MKKMLFFGLALIFTTPTGAWALDPDFKLLKSVGVDPNGPNLLKYFRDRTVKAADPKEMANLIAQLGDDVFQTREKAYQELVKLGPAGLVGLKLFEEHPDVEVRLRVQEIKQLVMAKVDPAVQAAAARLLGAIKPAGAPEVMLNYIPFAPDQTVVDELVSAVKASAIRDGKADPVVIKALTDPMPIKRLAAAEALVGDKQLLPTIRKMVKDTDPLVRLRVAMALITTNKEKDALPVLVDLLGILGPEHLWQAEEILVRLAGNDAPAVSLGNNQESRKKCRDMWSAWLTKNEAKVDLAKIDQVQSLLNYTLIVQQSLNRFVNGRRLPATGEVMELDGQKNQRWKFEVNTYPVDAQVIRQDRVLVAEYHGMKVTERDFTGKVLWEQMVGGNPISVQGLPNENVFAVMQNRLVEFDRNHKEVFTLNRGNHDIFRGRKLRNGDVVFITNGGMLTRMDGATQRIIKNFHVGNIPVLFGSIDLLPNGGVLVPDFQQNRVIEFDADGKQVKQFNVQWPNSVQRLPNGHTLVGSQNTRRVIEFDVNGVERWSHNTDGMVFNARKR